MGENLAVRREQGKHAHSIVPMLQPHLDRLARLVRDWPDLSRKSHRLNPTKATSTPTQFASISLSSGHRCGPSNRITPVRSEHRGSATNFYSSARDCALSTPLPVARIAILLLAWSLPHLCAGRDRKPLLLFVFWWTSDRAESSPRLMRLFCLLPWSSLRMLFFGRFHRLGLIVCSCIAIDKSNFDYRPDAATHRITPFTSSRRQFISAYP
jgi:hypothetical protein